MIKLSKEELKDLYIKHGSIKIIAKYLGIPKSALQLQFKKHGIKPLKDDIKKDDIKNLLKELGSVHKVANRLGVSLWVLNYHMRKYGIANSRDRFPYSKKQLIKLYKEEGSITKVAVRLSSSYSTVRYWYSELGIKVKPSGMSVFRELRDTPMTDLHKSVLIGSMLGDGGIWLAPHCKNARLYVCHCEKQLAYLKWIRNLLKPFSRPIKQTEKAGMKRIGEYYVNGSNFYRFYTIAHPDITAIYHKYYKDSLKRVDDTIIDKVDLLAMSIWFGDDGSIQRNKNGEPTSCSLSTCSFTYKEHLVLVEVVRKFFNGTIKIKKHSGYYKGKKREQYVLCMYGKKEVNDFLNMIKLILPKDIHYKLS